MPREKRSNIDQLATISPSHVFVIKTTSSKLFEFEFGSALEKRRKKEEWAKDRKQQQQQQLNWCSN